MRARASTWFLASFAAVLAGYLLLPTRMQDLVYDLAAVAAAGAVVAGVRLHRPASAAPWWAFATGLALFAAGDVAYSTYDYLGHTPSVPSGADVLYLAGYPALALGLLLVVRRRAPGSDLAGALDGLMVAGGASVLAWAFVMRPYASDRTLHLAAQIVPIAYPALDLLLVAVLTRLVVGGGKEPAFRLLAASMVVLVVTDVVYGTMQAHGTYATGSYVDLGWLVSYGLWGAAALHPTMRHLVERAPPRPPRHRLLGVAALAGATLTVPVAMVVADARGDALDRRVLEIASIVVFGLAMARIAVLTGALQRSNRRQRTLTDAALALVGADGEGVVAAVATTAAVALCGGPRAWAVWEVDGAPLCAAGARGETGHLLRRDVVVDGAVAATIVAGDARPVRADVAADLELLCSQAGLALTSVAAVAERVQLRSERLFRSVVQASADVVALVTDDGIVRYASPAVTRTTGRSPEEVAGVDLASWLHPDDRGVAVSRFADVVAAGPGASAHLECRLVHADGTWRTIEADLTNLVDDPDVGAVVLNARDVSVRHLLEEELERQALTDTLTGLPNRTLFADRVAHALSRSERSATDVAVLVLDVDDFKDANDSLGHSAGDALLVETAARLRHCTRPGDTVARLGGDEFAIVLESEAMPAAAHRVAGRVIDAMQVPFAVHGAEVELGVSIGITTSTGGERVDDLLRDAELAMYAAKRAGKARAVLFEPPMHEAAVRRLETAAELRRGLDTGQVVAFYQPIIDAATGAVAGVEALARWRHPSRGIVGPVDFVPVAEATGLVVPLGRTILTQACRDAARWRAAGLTRDDFYVSVNLSARQLQDPSIVDDVEEALRASGLAPTALVLEITESTLIEDLEVVLARAQALKARGVRLAVDDFGTGYSSLSYLSSLPVDIVKIDKFFVDRVTEGVEGRAMVRGVLDLARSLGLHTTAEGVEREEQRAALEALGCDTLQGYLFAPALPAPELVDWWTVTRPG